jgi:Vibrio cholerae sialidase, lectin insertion/FG-GAP-like repeat
MKSKIKAGILAALLSVTFASQVRAQLPNAWQINDNYSGGLGVIQYMTNLTAAQVFAATNNGWRYDLVSRMVSDSGGAATHSIAFGDGTRRFYIFFDLNGSGQLTAQLLGDTTYTLTSAAEGTNYHTHEIIYDPVTGAATYRFDGSVIATWAGNVSSGQSNQVMWGANSSTGLGVMNYHHAEFSIAGQGVIASYDAGFDGNPAAAPSPTAQGWERYVFGATISEAPVSPDSVLLPPLVTTLAASAVLPNSATLNAQLYPAGLATGCYFEYGLTTNYGNFSPTNPVSGDDYSTNVSSAVTGLSGGTQYHFRAVITNSFITVTGADMTFTTPAYIITQPATDLTPNTATLNASVSTYGLDTAYYWEYGTTTNYGNFTPTNTISGGIAATNVSFDVGGLSPATTYQFRAVAANRGGIETGTNLSFVTTSVYSLGYPEDYGSVAWGDYDDDGLLDVLQTTPDGVEVWHNTGAGFTLVNTGLPTIDHASVAWGDYDNDGRLDILLAGLQNGTPICQIWRNTGSGFTNINAGLPGFYDGSVAWGDYDNDGRLDILITGTTNDSAGFSEIWRNNGDGTFSNVTATLAPGLPGVFLSSAAWGDYDNDGRLDILIAGLVNGNNGVCQIWRNTGAGFTNINANLPGVSFASVAWGDYDNDGKLDVLLTGTTNASYTGAIAQVWHNTGSGFTNLNAGLTGVYWGSVAWGDYDNDGRPDILLTGFNTTPSPSTQIWRNTGTGFVKFPSSLPALSYSSVAWGDANNDGRLDTLLMGSGYAGVWLNLQPVTNTPPIAPSGLSATVNFPSVSLSWGPAGDAETPAAGLTYNLRVGTTPGGSDVVNPEADASGFRRVPAMGNQQTGTNAILALPAGTYYGSVQAVDGAFAGSPFATEGSFTVPSFPLAFTLQATDVLPNSATLNASINPNSLATSYYFEYGSTTSYGSFTVTNSLPAGNSAVLVNDAISGLNAGVTYHYRVVASNVAGVSMGEDQAFIERAIDAGLPPIIGGAGAWGDYDRDGRLDLMLAGQASDATVWYQDIWRNTGSGFTNLNLRISPYNGDGNSVAWADYDNDGNVDVVRAGQNYSFFGNVAFLELWRNLGNTISNVSTAITPLGSGSVTWGDFDNDGRQDLLVTGIPASGNAPSSQIWRNTGGGFTNINAGLPGVWAGSSAWGDFDNDGRLDLILTGATNSYATNGIAQIWRNTGTGFTNLDAGLPGVCYSSAAWGDYDNDGRLDLLLAGTTNGVASGAICQVWHNTGHGFTNLNLNLPGVYLGTVAWGDYDNDGRLDILLTGTTNGSASGAIAEVWRNTGSGFTNLDLGLPGVYNPMFFDGISSGTAAFGDYDNDGRLDILLCGTTTDGSGLCGVWINSEAVTNNVPSAPSGLGETIVNGQLQLHWNPASDAQTPSAGLSYNLRVGTTPGGVDVTSPEAETNGFRLLPALGNAQMRTNAFLAGLVPGTTYYWSVQAVDTAFAGGSFAPEVSFVMPGPSLNIVRTNSNVIVSWQPSYAGVVLQESPRLNPAAWTNSPSGTTNPVVVPITNETMFYRLFKP